jgi:hypothetical protein
MIIVLCGPKGSGKDTVANMLLTEHGFVKEAFANPLKQMVEIAFPRFSYASLYGSSELREEQFKEYPFSGICVSCGRDCEESFGTPGTVFCSLCNLEYPEFVSPRIALQTLGTEWGRRLSPNIWVSAAFDRILIRKNKGLRDRDWVITDARFANEIDFARAAGAITVRITGRSQGSSNHPSEMELQQLPESAFHHTLDNSGSLADLEKNINSMLYLIFENQHKGTTP